MPKTEKIVPLHPKDHNHLMDRDTYLYHAGRVRQAEDEMEAIKVIHKKKIKRLRRSARDSGMHLKTLDLMTKIRRAQGDETPDAAASRMTHYAEMEGLRLQSMEQLELELKDARKKKTGQYNTGYDHGLSGLDMLSDSQTYMEGWRDGNARKLDLDERHPVQDDTELNDIGQAAE